MGGSRGRRGQGPGSPPGTLQVAKGLFGNSDGTDHPAREAIMLLSCLLYAQGGGVWYFHIYVGSDHLGVQKFEFQYFWSF